MKKRKLILIIYANPNGNIRESFSSLEYVLHAPQLKMTMKNNENYRKKCATIKKNIIFFLSFSLFLHERNNELSIVYPLSIK